MPGLLQKKEPNPTAVCFNFFLLLFGIVYSSPFITLRKEKWGGGGAGGSAELKQICELVLWWFWGLTEGEQSLPGGGANARMI